MVISLTVKRGYNALLRSFQKDVLCLKMLATADEHLFQIEYFYVGTAKQLLTRIRHVLDALPAF